MVEEKKDICPVCGGTGQVSFFQGVSRFLLTTEECSECAGTGRKKLPDVERSKPSGPGKKMPEEKS